MAEEIDHPIDAALEKLSRQFNVLARVGYTGGPLVGEQALFRLTVPFIGKVMDGITVVSNLPILPYKAQPVQVVQDATFKWIYTLCSVLQAKDSRLALLMRSYEWEMKLAQQAEETRQLQLFRHFLGEKVEELAQTGHAVDILREVKRMAWDDAPTGPLRHRCTQAVADRREVIEAINKLPGGLQGEFAEWLEPFV